MTESVPAAVAAASVAVGYFVGIVRGFRQVGVGGVWWSCEVMGEQETSMIVARSNSYEKREGKRCKKDTQFGRWMALDVLK